MSTQSIPVVNMQDLWTFTSDSRTYRDALKDAVFDIWCGLHPDRRARGHWIIPANCVNDLLSLVREQNGIAILMFDAATLGFSLLGSPVVIDERRGDCLRFYEKDDQ